MKNDKKARGKMAGKQAYITFHSFNLSTNNVGCIYAPIDKDFQPLTSSAYKPLHKYLQKFYQ